jgi:hypothetical protein
VQSCGFVAISGYSSRINYFLKWESRGMEGGEDEGGVNALGKDLGVANAFAEGKINF